MGILKDYDEMDADEAQDVEWCSCINCGRPVGLSDLNFYVPDYCGCSVSQECGHGICDECKTEAQEQEAAGWD